MRPSKAERQSKILSELEHMPSLRVADLAQRLSVSTETIRRDLDEMTERGELNRTYGGAIRPAAEEPVVSVRHSLFVEERQRIARAVIPLIHDAKVLMIGSGATTVHLARRIAVDMKNITVITHSFGVATVLSINPTIRVVLAPGDYHATEGATVGAHTVEFFGRFHADVALVGASGLGPTGPSDALIDVATVYSAMCRSAARRIVVADHSKHGQIFAAVYATWPMIDTLVSDLPPERDLAEMLRRSGVGLQLAP